MFLIDNYSNQIVHLVNELSFTLQGEKLLSIIEIFENSNKMELLK